MLQVIIVDDALIMRKEIRRMIENLGHKVVGEAKNAEEAISMHDSLKADLITMDITMPGNDGIYATKKIVEKNTDTKIIMVTSHGQEIMISSAIKAGAVAYIMKPITEDKFSETINMVFEEYK